jgi:hypothetical protein
MAAGMWVGWEGAGKIGAFEYQDVRGLSFELYRCSKAEYKTK